MTNGLSPLSSSWTLAKPVPIQLPGSEIANRRTLEVGDEIRSFLDTARTSAIWSSKEVYTGTEDGTAWTFEALHNREYRAHHRANAPSPALDSLARSFVELGGLQWETELNKRQ